MTNDDDPDDFDDVDDEEGGLLSGPDERDQDLLDGSWEERYYASERRSRDWNAVAVGVTLLVVMGMLLPTLFIALR